MMVSEFFPKKATFTMLYYGFFHFFKVRKKCGVRWSRTPQMSALCGVRDRTPKTSVRVFTSFYLSYTALSIVLVRCTMKQEKKIKVKINFISVRREDLIDVSE